MFLLGQIPIPSKSRAFHERKLKVGTAPRSRQPELKAPQGPVSSAARGARGMKESTEAHNADDFAERLAP